MSSPSGPSAATASQPASDQSAGGVAFAWIAAWTVLLVILWALNRSRIGHLVIYYLLVLMIVLLLVGNAGWFAHVMQPFTDAVKGQGTQQEEVIPPGGGLPPDQTGVS